MFARIYRHIFLSRLEDIPFLIFLSFLLTFIVSRLIVYFALHDIMDLPGGIANGVIIRGIHIHHFSWGIGLLAVIGYLSLLGFRAKYHRLLAILYGIGLGLTFDEFGMWLKLSDNYYIHSSYDALVIVFLILLNIVYFPGFWSRTGRKFLRLGYSLFHLPHKIFFSKSGRIFPD